MLGFDTAKLIVSIDAIDFYDLLHCFSFRSFKVTYQELRTAIGVSGLGILVGEVGIGISAVLLFGWNFAAHYLRNLAFN